MYATHNTQKNLREDQESFSHTYNTQSLRDLNSGSHMLRAYSQLTTAHRASLLCRTLYMNSSKNTERPAGSESFLAVLGLRFLPLTIWAFLHSPNCFSCAADGASCMSTKHETLPSWRSQHTTARYRHLPSNPNNNPNNRKNTHGGGTLGEPRQIQHHTTS